MRAVAVLPVILFHAGFRFMSGGFVGVDVFFVISGFLITGILAREIAEQRYSIIRFYQRRARRIFPALTLVTLATLGTGYFLLTPKEYVELAKSAAAVSIFSSNFYFWKSISYFDFAGAVKPLLHTWSLAVEEQYYLFFPLLLRLLHLRNRTLTIALWVITISSLALAAALVPWKPSAAFYLLPSRAWELMIGGLLAVGSFPVPRTRSAASTISALGLLLIAVPMVWYSPQTPFPGLAAIPPVIGTALVIAAAGQGLVPKMLSHPVPVAVGKASYSIYLWHFPIFAFASYLVAGTLSTTTAVVLSLASIALGFVSLQLIERPFRVPTRVGAKMAGIAAFGMIAVGAAAAVIILLGGVPARLAPKTAALVSVQDDEQRHHSECMTVDQKIVSPAHACLLGAPGVAPTALLWGDSHAMVTATALEQAAVRRHASFLFAADADCPPGIGFRIDRRVNPGLTNQLSYRYCDAYNQQMLEFALKSPGVETVIFSARWTNWRIGAPANPAEPPADVRLIDAKGAARSIGENAPKWERGFLALVDRLTASGKKVVIVGPLPEPTFNVPHQLYVQRFGLARRATPISVSDYRIRHAKILAFFRGMTHKKGVRFIWPEQVLCSNGVCPIVDRGIPLYFDQDHLSVYGARKTSVLYDSAFGSN